MKAKCDLAPDINSCAHYDPIEQKCNSNNEGCGFYRKPGAGEKQQYTRKERWYEKYYKKR